MRIVLVYLGKSIPDYFWDNVNHLLKIQENYSIDVITSGNPLKNSILNDRLEYFDYKPTKEVDNQLSRLEIDHKFRDGFWRYSLERLFAITQHHKNFPQENILHFESDILVLPNFPFAIFESMQATAWPRVDARRDVASIIYLPALTESLKFERSLLNIVANTKSIDDMKIMNLIARNENIPTQILPSIKSAESSLLDQSHRDSKSEVESISNGFNDFKGIFDPASIGIWLTGTDPRNYFGLTKRFDYSDFLSNGVYVNPALGQYEIDEFGNLCLREFDSLTPIYNLHIHSKNRRYFQSNYLEQLREDVSRSSNGRSESNFSIRILTSLIVQNLKKGTLLRFLSWLPVVQKVKKLLGTASPRNIAE